MKRFLLWFVRLKLVQKTIILILRFPLWRNWRIKEYLKGVAEPKLQLGCCKNPLPGWLNTDISLRSVYGVYLDAGKRFPFQEASFEYVYSEHLFEHLTYQQGLNMLKESYRILKPGGVIRIATPDLQFLVGLYQAPEKPVHKQYIEFSAQQGKLPAEAVYVINRFHTTWGHQIIYDKKTLSALLEQVGFKDVRSCEVGESKHPALTGIEGHFKELGVEFNRLETMVLEATK